MKLKVVYIVGGTSGIGLAIARELAARGMRICIFGRRTDWLQQAITDVSTKGFCTGFTADATNRAALNEAFQQAIAAVGIPDVLINCAGRAIPMHFSEISDSQMQQTFSLNFQTAWNACQLLVPVMKESGGVIVNTSSVGGLIGVFGYTDYSASKFALIGFSEALRQEVAANNIRVQVLCPPDTQTPGFEEENKTKPVETAAISAGAKLVQPEIVAREFANALGGKKFLIIPGFDSKLSWLMKRFAPWLVDGIIKRAISQAQKTKA
ncbi:MAG: SDR family oxidoreductase [Chitinophagales bacterium]